VITEDGKNGGDEDDHDGTNVDVNPTTCTNPTFSATASSPTCFEGQLQSDGKLCISNLSSNAVKVGYSIGATYTGPSFATASAATNGCIVSNLSNPAAPTTYTIRVFVSETCYTDQTVVFMPNTTNCGGCTKPTFSATASSPTCFEGQLQSDGKLCISNLSSNAVKVGYSIGATYTGASFATASAATNGCIVSNLSNPAAPTTYTIRVFVSGTCYADQTVTLLPNTNCGGGCTSPTFTATTTSVSCVNGVLQTDGKLCISNLSSNAVKVGYSIGATYTGPSFATASAATNGCIVSNLSNPAAPTTYTIRVFVSGTCYADQTVTLLPNTNCGGGCTSPTFTATATSVSCVNGVLQTDGKLCISNLSSNAVKVGYSIGATYTGASFATASAATNGCIVSNLSNPAAPVTYTIRVFASETCYTDQTVVLVPNIGCKPVCTLDIKEVSASKCVCTNNTNDKVGVAVTLTWASVPTGAKINVTLGGITKTIDPTGLTTTVVTFEVPSSTTTGNVTAVFTDGTCSVSKPFNVSSSVDNIPPVIVFKNSQLNTIRSGDTLTFDCSNPPNFGLKDAMAMDNCDANPTLEFVDVAMSIGNCPVDGYLFIMHCKYVAKDVCGNTSEFHFYVKVKDSNSPIISAPANITVNCGSVPAVATPLVSDLCDDQVKVTFNEKLNAQGCKGSYTIERVWTATDH